MKPEVDAFDREIENEESIADLSPSKADGENTSGGTLNNSQLGTHVAGTIAAGG